MSALKYWVWLSGRGKMSPDDAKGLLERFGSPENIYFADTEELETFHFKSALSRKIAEDKDLSGTMKTIDRCVEAGYRIITMQDSEYPVRLKNIFDPPVVLYVRGKLPPLDEEAAVALVGTRKCSAYGVKTAERFGYELAKCGCVVVTGLARGIDTSAALGALRGGGKVLGVLGCGLDTVYPAENDRLFDDVAVSGAIITEYPPDEGVRGRNFPVRNRIISGVSVGVAVIEAPEKSGALITAAHALEQGRDVFAVPGNVDAVNSKGTNMLIREGAVPVLCGEDIAGEYQWLFKGRAQGKIKGEKVPLDSKMAVRLVKKQVKDGDYKLKSDKKVIDNKNKADYDLERPELSGDELAIAQAIGHESVHVDEITARCGMTAARTMAALTMMEIRGIVRQEKGKYFRLASFYF